MMAYCICETSEGLYEVWGYNPTTGYHWLIAEYNTRDEARMMIRHWQGAGA
jgi:hypothetical protein